MRGPFWIEPGSPLPFPPVELALTDPDGLLAIGGDLSPSRLLEAYRHGIFPWFSEGQPILWWSPDPRAVLFPDRLHISRSLGKTLRRGRFRVTADRAFREVVAGCAAPRSGHDGTWITGEMADAYARLHDLGTAHSVEVWESGDLVGGIYGVALGRVFFGESMFSRATDASKVAIVHLARQLQRWEFPLLDCQVHNPHLETLGAERIPRKQFLAALDAHCTRPPVPAPWHLEPGPDGQVPRG
ncbi:MAG TPA: leucyl/phenylalanyl-tRNA--protein transferase [Deferrisomatales bacterium]|nr:leucyl/phenylalanyl-tRNA--protein transferase [Deferrisomatales bacterium]